MDYEHMEFVEAIEELARSVGVDVPREEGFNQPGHRGNDELARLYPLLERASDYFRNQLRHHPQASRAVEYLKQRGLTGEVAAQFGIGYAPPGWDNLESALGKAPQTRDDLQRLGLTLKRDDGSPYDRFRDRVMFPIRDRRGRVIGFGGRVLGDDKPKYLNSPESPTFHKGQELYGLFEARKTQRTLERLLVVEGYMDVVALAQFGIGYAVATLGTATTRDHLDRIFRVVPEVVFCFDGDRAGRDAAWRALENVLPALQDGRQVRFLFLPDGEDPDSLVRKEGQQAFEQRIAHATPLSEYLFEHLATQVDLAIPEGRARLVELARPLLKQIEKGVFRQLLLQQLARMTQIDTHQLTGMLGNDTPMTASPQPATPPRRPPQGNTISTVRLAISLLLHKPAIAQEVEIPQELQGDERPGVPLLLELLEITRHQPHLTTGALLERWRGTEQGKHLHKLVATPLQIPEAGMPTELQGALERLTQQRREQEMEKLLNESRFRNLSDEEKIKLNQLIRRN